MSDSAALAEDSSKTVWFSLSRSRQLTTALIVAELLALFWWAVALWVKADGRVPVWYDQETTFLVVGRNVLTPYAAAPNFLNVPWTGLMLTPFALVPLEWATLLQECAYFAVVTLVIFRLGGGLRAVVISLTSFIALDASLQLNVDWLPLIGLLVPPTFSGIFLAMKPQIAFGYWFSLKPRQLLPAIGVTAAVALLSLVIWGWWPPEMLDNLSHIAPTEAQRNLAPSSLLSPFIAYPLGLVLGWYAFRRKDAAIGFVAWVFFVPYFTLYSALPLLAVCSARWWKITLLVSVLLWLILGGYIGLHLISL